MRKVCVVLASMAVVSFNAWAAPCYGTKMPEKGRQFWGLQTYTVFDSDLNKDHGSLKSQQEHVLLSYGVTDWFALDLKASIGTVEHAGSNGYKTKYDEPLWGGGYGFRVRLYENGPVKAVGGFQHISIHPRSLRQDGAKHNAILDDWQGFALVSYDLKKFTPYTGVLYGTKDYLYRLNNDADRIYTPEDRRFDAVLGADIPLTKKVWLNVEGQFGASAALATSVNVRF